VTVGGHIVQPKPGIDFLYHIVSTWSGESGSPLLDVDGRRVVAVDSRCDRANGSLPPPTDSKCATRLLTSPANLAISGWSVLKDPVLGLMLPAVHTTLGEAAKENVPKM
jgi:hypothetical protein